MEGIGRIRRLQRAPELVAERITDSIVRRKLPVGTALPPETQLAKEIGVSRVALREGLRILEARGLVEVRAGRNGGTTILRPSHEALTHHLTILLQYEGVTLGHVLRTRMAIERECVRAAAQAATPEDVANIRKVVETCLGECEDWDHQTVDFHLEVARASHNPILAILMQTIRELVYSATPQKAVSEERREETNRIHERIVQAIEEHDADKAERRLTRHLNAIKECVAELHGEDVDKIPWTGPSYDLWTNSLD